MVFFGHVAWHDTLLKFILQGILEGSQRHSGQRKNWLKNIKDWTVQDLLTIVQSREE